MANRRERQHSTQKTPIQSWETNTRTTPIAHERTTRRRNVSVVTSSMGGKLMPLKCIELLREDRVLNSNVTVNVQMAETANMLLNPVRVAAAAYFVPKLALDRFQDMGTIDRSYNGQVEQDGTTVVPWFQNWSLSPPYKNIEILVALGLHVNGVDSYNTDYVESYNAVWNHIAKNRSPSIALRSATDTTIGPAFWANTQMKHVVPTFDDAMMEGEVPLTITNPDIVIRARGRDDSVTGVNGQDYVPFGHQSEPGVWEGSPNGIWGELTENGVTVSLANIDLARETAAWARLRTQYQGKSEEWMMDQLLAGIRIPDEGLKQPILLDTRETVVGMSQRYSSTAGSLTESVVDGRTAIDLRLRVPQVSCGGCIVIVAQALPEQIYERQRDYYFSAADVSDLPNRISDELDPQPVSMVKNVEVDEEHSTPTDLFGYAPLNHQWTGGGPNIGGKYYMEAGDAWFAERNRIWDTGVVDPALGPDFYMSTSLQHNVFADSNTDPFEWWVNGQVLIEGLTYFGPGLRESTDDFESVLGMVDKGRLVGDGTDTPT
jgi:hypothetical protein